MSVNYLNQVPQASQTLAQTQNLILQNFTTYIDFAFQVDHVPYTTPGQGKHNWVTFPLQSSLHSFTGTDSGFFSALDSFSGANQIFITPPGSVTPLSPVPMTACSKVQNGYSYLPSGIIMQWGFASMTGTTANVVFVKNFVSAVFSVVATTSLFNGTNTPISIAPASVFGFTATSNTSGMSFYWIAIGN
jgi:hypothetical protein